MNLGVFSPKLSRIMLMTYYYIWILPFCLGAMISIVDSEQMSILWNKSNPMFQEEGGARLNIPLRTNLVIKCPVLSDPPEYYRLYWVSEQGYRDCFRPHNASTLMVDCVPPYFTTEFTQEIVDFTGVPGGKDFKPGQSYYIATFSTGTQHGLTNELGGACLENKLKLNVTVVNKITPTSPKPTQKPVSTTRRPGTTKPNLTQKPTTQSTTSTTTTTTQSTTITKTSLRTHPTDIPDITDIPVISVPDPPGGPGGNTATIDVSSAQTLGVSSALVLSICLSLLHILYFNIPYIQR